MPGRLYCRTPRAAPEPNANVPALAVLRGARNTEYFGLAGRLSGLFDQSPAGQISNLGAALGVHRLALARALVDVLLRG